MEKIEGKMREDYTDAVMLSVAGRVERSEELRFTMESCVDLAGLVVDRSTGSSLSQAELEDLLHGLRYQRSCGDEGLEERGCVGGAIKIVTAAIHGANTWHRENYSVHHGVVNRTLCDQTWMGIY
jgi:hypothetical protein